MTEEEVKNGILYNPEAAKHTLFFDREYTNIDMKDPAASKFIDSKRGEEDIEATNLLRLLKAKISKYLPAENIAKRK